MVYTLVLKIMAIRVIKDSIRYQYSADFFKPFSNPFQIDMLLQNSDKEKQMTAKPTLPPAGLMRRMAALSYDGLIILAIEMLAAGLIIAILEALVAAGLMTYGAYQDASDLLGHHPLWSYVYPLYLGVIWIGFFVYFWTKAGQTVGMRAWKLRVQNPDGSLISPTQALIRIGTSAFGLASLFVVIDHKKRGFHDLWAKTEVVVLPKAI